jgi:hypothetical protein
MRLFFLDNAWEAAALIFSEMLLFEKMWIKPEKCLEYLIENAVTRDMQDIRGDESAFNFEAVSTRREKVVQTVWRPVTVCPIPV